MGDCRTRQWEELGCAVVPVEGSPIFFAGEAAGAEAPWWLRRKESACQYRRCGFNPGIRKIPGRRVWLPTPVVLPGEFHGQKRLVGYSPWGHKESDTTERLILSLSAGVVLHRGWEPGLGTASWTGRWV